LVAGEAERLDAGAVRVQQIQKPRLTDAKLPGIGTISV
jgi:hypothetical protein